MIDAPTVLADLREIVAGKGADYVYQNPAGDNTCVYVDDAGKPSCIVGHVLAKHNLLALDVAVSNASVTDIDMVPDEMFDHFTEPALLALGAAQEAQDGGADMDGNVINRLTWGEALAAAERATEAVAA